MGNLPDFTPLIYFGVFGLVCAAAIILAVVGWGGYHLVAALAMYLGA